MQLKHWLLLLIFLNAIGWWFGSNIIKETAEDQGTKDFVLFVCLILANIYAGCVAVFFYIGERTVFFRQ